MRIENSSHLLIVLPEGGLCFAVWSMVLTLMVYFCDLYTWTIVVVTELPLDVGGW